MSWGGEPCVTVRECVGGGDVLGVEDPLLGGVCVLGLRSMFRGRGAGGTVRG